MPDSVLICGERELNIAGIENSRWEARVLAAHVLGLETARTFEPLSFSRREEESFFCLVKRRSEGEPLQYVTGCWDFYGREFLLSPSVLIPRPETEQLIDLVLERELTPSPAILDVGTGSGAIGITLALELPSSAVTGTDISPNAVEQARINAARLKTPNFTACVSDLTSDLQGPFDVVTANLPYIPSEEIPGLQSEVREHEPILALDGGPDGTSLILRLVKAAEGITAPGAFVVLETDRNQGSSVPGFFRHDFWKEIRTHRDFADRHRFVSALRR